MVRAQRPRDFEWSVVVGLSSRTITALTPKRSSNRPIANLPGPPPMNTDIRRTVSAATSIALPRLLLATVC
jgi:hypothetical protein